MSSLYIRASINIVCLAAGMLSCVSNKKIIYLQNKTARSAVDSLKYAPQEVYQLQSGDLLQITFRSYNEKATTIFNAAGGSASTAMSTAGLYFNGYQVDQDGYIEMPVLGKVAVRGKTVDEIRGIVAKEADRYFKDAAITIKLSGITYSILGEVRGPGRYTLYQDRVNIMEAVATAGDLTELANRGRVDVFRHYPSGVIKYTVDLTDVNLIRSPYYFVKPNDVIVVSPLKVRAAGTGTTGLATFQVLLTVVTTGLLFYQLFAGNK
jgi:polysaccharide export outer membrane protein